MNLDQDSVKEEHGILTYNGRMFSLLHFQFKIVNISTSKLKTCVCLETCFLALGWNTYLPPATKLGQGNIFRSLCQEFCSRGDLAHCILGYHPDQRQTPKRQTPQQQPPSSRPPKEQTTPVADPSGAVYAGRYR